MAELKWETPKRNPKGSMYDNLNSLRETAETAINQLKIAKSEDSGRDRKICRSSY